MKINIRHLQCTIKKIDRGKSSFESTQLRYFNMGSCVEILWVGEGSKGCFYLIIIIYFWLASLAIIIRRIYVLKLRNTSKNKTNHPISSNSHPSATANKAIHDLIIGGGGLQNQREHHINLTKYEAVHSMAVSENNSSLGMIIFKTICIDIYLKGPNNQRHSK